MRTEYLITLDTHARTTDACVMTGKGKLVRREHLATAIPPLRELIEAIPRPRCLAFEEGPMAGWLYRNLKPSVDEVVVCDPRRNALIAKDGDKDDPIDAGKLNELFRGGYLRPVHQQESDERAGFKQLVGAYHCRVRERVRRSNQVLGLGKRWGVLFTRRMLREAEAGPRLLSLLSGAGAPKSCQLVLETYFASYLQAVEQEERLETEMVAAAKTQEVIGRLREICGYGWVRAATFVAYVDTPFRFAKKSALWKYVGIGLRREKSGASLDILKVEQECNRMLRNVAIGAAQTAIRQGENEFAERYRRWIRQGVSPRNARRNVARVQTAAAWGMWKSGQVYQPRWVEAEP